MSFQFKQAESVFPTIDLGIHRDMILCFHGLWQSDCDEIPAQSVSPYWLLCVMFVLQAMADIVMKHLHTGEVCSPTGWCVSCLCSRQWQTLWWNTYTLGRCVPLLTAPSHVCVAGNGRHCEESPTNWWSVFTSVDSSLPNVRQRHLWHGQRVLCFPAVPAGWAAPQVIFSLLNAFHENKTILWLMSRFDVWFELRGRVCMSFSFTILLEDSLAVLFAWEQGSIFTHQFYACLLCTFFQWQINV